MTKNADFKELADKVVKAAAAVQFSRCLFCARSFGESGPRMLARWPLCQDCYDSTAQALQRAAR